MKPGQPSETAGRIAVNAVAAALDPELRRLVADPDEPFSAWFAEEHSPQSRQQLALWRSGAPMLRKLSDAIEPGGAVFVLARKLWIEDRVRRALSAGAAQMAVIGAGYDTLSLRLAPAFPDVRFVELDHPATQEVKRRVLEARDAHPRGLVLAPLDLSRQAPGAALREAEWRADRPAVVVAEGVFMYIEEAPLDAVFASLAGALAPGSRFLFTLMDRGKLQDPAGPTARTAKLLAASGEPLRSSLDPAEVPGFLSARGFRLVETADAGALRRAYLEPRGVERALSEGEFLVEAERT